LSWVADSIGIYFDSTGPSQLEQILQETDFSASLLKRAKALQREIISRGVTKYNVSPKPWLRTHRAAGRKLILVPGQAETDASLRYGAPAIRSNLELLAAVRRSHPDAFLVYRPHSSTLAEHQGRAPVEREFAQLADETITEAPMGQLLEEVDEVHTITSLAGFEALIREKAVTTYGQPFYAGWGLSKDYHAPPHRTRRLSLPELIAGSLILYPLYISHVTGRYTTPERALEELDGLSSPAPISSTWLSLVRSRFGSRLRKAWPQRPSKHAKFLPKRYTRAEP
jgi:capsular polysaccharide export protein